MAPTRQDYAALVQEARAFELTTLHRRSSIMGPLPKPAAFNLVHIITGIRRCGKTFYTFQLIEDLLKQGVPRDHIFYFNFSDDRLRPAPSTLLNDIIEEYWRQVPQARQEGAYLFLDEVQEADDWQGFCQRIAEHERATLVITGSSSKLSSDEIATSFRGRSQEHPMHPLSFREFCEFRDVAVPKADELQQTGAVSPQLRTRLESAFDEYLVRGGFPGVQSLPEPDAISMLQAYMRDVVARDVMERNTRFDISLVTQVALFGLRNTGCDLSVNNLVESLRAVGYKTSWETVNEVVRLFCQAHLLRLLPEYSVILSPDSTQLQKVYAVDPGMAYATARANQQDIGKRLETAVYIELSRRLAGSRVEAVTSYTVPSNKKEKVDFLVGDALAVEPYALYQVTVDITAEKTRRRELGSLTAAMEKTGIEQGTVITLNEEGTEQTAAGSVDIIPAWKWSLLGA